MDGRNTFAKLKKMCETLEGEMTITELKRQIIMNIGSSENVVYRCLVILNDTGLIKDIGNARIQIVK